ncbi:MAG: hypothetical protein GDA67_07020 [Nitrospira sp. CR1.3]|nr:hypothetical protein [Nitrospira sp. CR1.3]
MEKLLVVIDETGGSRPLERGRAGFGVAAIVLPHEKMPDLKRACKDLPATVGNSDFKYKHVQNSSPARRQFLDALNTADVGLFGSYASESGVAAEIKRTSDAGNRYGTLAAHTNNLSTSVLMNSFLGYTIAAIGRHAWANDYVAEVYWDRRTDEKFMRESFNEHVAALEKHSPEYSIKNHIIFAGIVTGDLYSVARLSGVIAGDLKAYFDLHGARIWGSLDPRGLVSSSDPHISTRPSGEASRIVKTHRGQLADPDPYTASDRTVLLGGYYKRFMKHDVTGRRLITFCDPSGHMGVLEIDHSRLWHIRQLAD